MEYSVKELARKTNSEIFGEENLIIEEIIFDSRLIFSSQNCAFIAIDTPKNSGKNFIPDAVKKGIKVIISTEKNPNFPEITWIITPNTTQFLRILAKKHFENLSLKTIGITGSNGKTIVKEWLYQCLWNEKKVVKSPKSYNSKIGLPLSLLEADVSDEIGIFEVGISQPTEMEKQVEIFQPNIGIFTYLGTAHSEYFQDEKQKLDEKLKLFRFSDTIIFNGDNSLVLNTIKNTYPEKRLIFYGLKSYNSVYIKSPLDQKEAFDIQLQDNQVIKIPFQNRDGATFHNALAVIATLKELGIENNAIVDKLNALEAIEMRMESVMGKFNNLIINDSYNLDLDSLKIALKTLSQYNNPKKVLVLTDIVDVKDDSEHLYSAVASLVNEQFFDKIFLIGNRITQFENYFSSPVFSFKNTEELYNNEVFENIENSLILLKGARKFGLENLKKELELQSHDTVLEVNLNAIVHNINVHKSFLKPTTKMMAMVKASSYGLGRYEIAELLQHHNIDYLAVAYADEGMDLRKHNITLPVMVMNPELNSYGTIIDYKLEPEIYNFKVLNLFIEKLKRKGVGEGYPIHIKLETGMHRLGFQREDLNLLFEIVKQNRLKIASIFTHLAAADDPKEEQYTLQQIKFFKENSEFILQNLNYRPILHVLNSPGITNYTDYQFDMVRIGIGMIGYSSNPKIKPLLQNAVCFKTIITQIAKIHSGETVGYNRRFKTMKDTKIATISVGYADGIPRSLSNGTGFVGIKGKLYPIQGNVCMDMLMVDIGDADLKEGDEVTIFNDLPSLEQFATWANTIPYEILTSISQRVKRIYIKD